MKILHIQPDTNMYQGLMSQSYWQPSITISKLQTVMKVFLWIAGIQAKSSGI